jgi:DNA-binding transcriptional regulator LsrR (DeoR family)
MRAAVAGGLVQGLLTDEATARLILEPPAALRNGA